MPGTASSKASPATAPASLDRQALDRRALDRRAFLSVSARFGLASTLFPGALYTLAAQAQATSPSTNKEMPKITPEMIDQAAALAGITITADQKAMMLDGLNEQRAGYAAIRKLQLPNSLPPAYIFDPMPPGLTAEEAGHILGAQGQIWTEYIPTPGRVEYMAYPRAAALAEDVWSSPSAKNYADFSARLAVHLKRLEELNWRTQPPNFPINRDREAAAQTFDSEQDEVVSSTPAA